jgi:hypothetical protein
MFNNLRSMVKRNGHGPNGDPVNGHGPDGHGTNGHDVDTEVVQKPGGYCRGANDLGEASADSVHLETEITVSDDYAWTLEVRKDQKVLGTMYSHDPFVLISVFRDYTIFYGDPPSPYAVWLRHRDSTRGAPMTTQFGQDVWLEFLRQLDPKIEECLDDEQTPVGRSSMFNEFGQPTNPDTVFERAYGVA